MPQIIPSKIAGIFNYPEAKQAMKVISSGHAMAYEREPNNPHDPNAIALYISNGGLPVDLKNPPSPDQPIRNIKCGYIPRAVAIMLKDKEILEIKKGSAFDMISITIA